MNKQETSKPRGLFDHIKAITQESYNPNYFDDLDESSRKSWSSYMIHRFISMNMDWTDIANLFQRYSYGLSDEVVYKLYASVIPKSRIFLRYIKGKKEGKYDKQLVEFVAKHYEVSTKEAVEYISITMMYQDGKEQIETLLKRYGFPNADIKKMMKGL